MIEKVKSNINGENNINGAISEGVQETDLSQVTRDTASPDKHHYNDRASNSADQNGEGNVKTINEKRLVF